MRSLGEKMSDVVVIKKIVRSMSSKFDYVVCSIKESHDLDSMSIDELQSSLQIYEQRMHGHAIEEQALKIAHVDNSGGSRYGQRTPHGRGRGRYRRGMNKALVECYYCHDLGHFLFECPKKNKEPKDEKETKAHFAETSEEMLLMAYTDADTTIGETSWFLDSGCSNHMCGRKELFSHLDETFRKSVKLGNNYSLCVMCKGQIHITINNVTQILTEVFYVPDLCNNLLSIGQLQEKCLVILVQHNKCKIYHPDRGLIIDTTMSLNRMFILLATIKCPVQNCFQILSQNPDHLWHCRYGLLSLDGLKTLHTKQMVHLLPQLKNSS